MNGPETFRNGNSAANGHDRTTEQARQGETSGHVRAILAVSLSCSLIALAAIYLTFFG